MATTTLSTVLEYPIEEVWSLIRDFNNYPIYIDGVTESVIEDGLGGDEVGAVRRFLYEGSWLRQRLAAHSDEQHMLTYAGIDPFVFPEGIVTETPTPAGYEGTMQLSFLDNGRTVLSWSVTVETAPEFDSSWDQLLRSLIEIWTASLSRTLDRGIAQPR